MCVAWRKGVMVRLWLSRFTFEV